MKYTGLPQENIASPHVGDGQAAPAVEETRMKEENPNERQKWRKQQLQDIAAAPAGTGGFCCQFRIFLNSCNVIIPVPVRKVKKIAVKPSHGAIDLHTLVDVVAFPAASPAIV